MKYFLGLISLLYICFFFLGASSTDVLLGTWKIQQVSESGNDISEKHNPEGNREITFYSEGVFESDGAPYGRNTGKYSYDEESGKLFLDGNIEGNDYRWTVTIKGDIMLWTSKGTERQESFVLSFTRK